MYLAKELRSPGAYRYITTYYQGSWSTLFSLTHIAQLGGYSPNKSIQPQLTENDSLHILGIILQTEKKQ